MLIKETGIYVRDVARSVRFYGGVMGFTLIGLAPKRHAFFRVGKAVLLCFNAKETRKRGIFPWHGARGSSHVAFEVSRKEYGPIKRRLGRKVKIIHEQQWGPKTRSFYFRDPDGNLLEIIEPGFWETLGPIEPSLMGITKLFGKVNWNENYDYKAARK